MSILHLLSTDGFISVNKILIKKIGLEHAVIIGELSSEYDYYSKRRELTQDGYFFSTVKNIEERTTIKEKRQRIIMNELEKINLIHTVKRGMPSKRYIKLNENELFKLFQENGKNGLNEGYSSAQMTELVPPVEATNKNIINKNIINNKDYLSEDKSSDVAAVIKFYKTLEKVPKVVSFSDKRKKHINARLREYGLEVVKQTLIKATESDFLVSNIGKQNFYDLDWIFNQNNFAKILEGKYDNKKTNNVNNKEIEINFEEVF